MLPNFTLIALALLTLAAIVWVRREKPFLLFAADDSDMKIAGDLSDITVSPPQESADSATLEFIRQKKNGNIEKGKALGRVFAQALLNDCPEVLKTILASETVLVHGQCKILYSFAVNKVIEEMSPNSVVAHATLSTFYQHIKERDEVIYQLINDSMAFSLYILCSRSNKEERSTYGEVFAKMCEEGDNPIYVKMGDELYELYYQMCADQLIGADYIR